MSQYGSIEHQSGESQGTQEHVNTKELYVTTRRNILGWYFYSFSSEPFVVSAVATYFPLLLERFARLNGVLLNDHSKPCNSESAKCVLPVFNKRFFVDTSSFALYTFSLSVFFQAITVITVSGLVDLWSSVRVKGHVLVIFSITGALGTIIISQLNNNQFYALPLMSIVTNSCYGVINVVGNSLLPEFANDLYNLSDDELSARTSAETGDTRTVDRLVSVISGRGASIGYFSALLVQLCTMYLVGKKQSSENIQLAMLFVGVWWLIFQAPMAYLFRDIPRTSVSLSPFSVETTDTDKTEKITWRSLGYGWLSLGESLMHITLLKDVMIFLLAWFIISDSTTSINSTAVLFSKTELNMSTMSLVLVSVITMISAMIGSYSIPYFFSKKLNIMPDTTMLIIVIWASAIPFYGILGFFFRGIGLKHPAEMYGVAVWYGLSLGGLAAVSRSVFSLIIPKGKESTFFSIFSITDKGSSIVGPLLIGLITDKTHQIRYAFFMLYAFLVISLPILRLLDVTRGKYEAEQLNREL